MRVLIVRKFTNLELHGQRLRAALKKGLLSRGNLDHLQVAHDEHYHCLQTLRTHLHKARIDFMEIGRDGAWPRAFAFDCVITVGGDGTLLLASHRLTKVSKIIGIRSSRSSVGYLCASGERGVPGLVKKLMADSLTFDLVTRITASIKRMSKKPRFQTPPVLNDILFTNSNPAATTRYRIAFGARKEIHKSSGIWISTAIGSSAGIFAAGGKLLKIADKRCQYLVRELYDDGLCEYKLTGKIFDPDRQALAVENRSEKAILALDGQHGSVNLDYGDVITIQRAPGLWLAKSDR